MFANKTPSVSFGRRAGWRTVDVLLVAGLSLVFAGCGPSTSTTERSAAPPPAVGSRVENLAGQSVDPFRENPGKAMVLIFVANDCPVSNQYAPEIRRLYELFHSKGVSFWLVHPNADESVEAVRKHAEEYRYPMAVLRDPGHELVRRAHARVTPEAAVFLPDGRLVYHGRIDDRYVDLGRDRPAPTKRDLLEVIDAIIKGETVMPISTRAIGCHIADGP